MNHNDLGKSKIFLFLTFNVVSVDFCLMQINTKMCELVKLIVRIIKLDDL